jgi:hypothetical protein
MHWESRGHIQRARSDLTSISSYGHPASRVKEIQLGSVCRRWRRGSTAAGSFARIGHGRKSCTSRSSPNLGTQANSLNDATFVAGKSPVVKAVGYRDVGGVDKTFVLSGH